MKFVKNRIDELLPLIRDKDVLELGCVGMGDDDSIGGSQFIHKKVSKVSKHCVGLDLNKAGIKQLKNIGYNVKVQNIEKPFNLKKKFDVVLLEEVIEHLNNPGVCIENVKRHLKKDGKLIFTTPNAQSLSFFLQRLLRDKISGVATEEHTHWHDINTIRTLLRRYGFNRFTWWYVQPLPNEETWKYKIIKFIYRFFPDRVGRNLVVVAEFTNLKKRKKK